MLTEAVSCQGVVARRVVSAGGECDSEGTHVVVGPWETEAGWTMMGIPSCKRHLVAMANYFVGFFPDPTGVRPLVMTMAKYRQLLEDLPRDEAADLGLWVLERTDAA